MQVTEDRGCFICGPDNPIGLKVDFVVDRARRRAECRLTVPEDFQGWRGVIHGGIIAALLDEASIYAGRSLGEQLVTAELAVKYRKPLPAGRPVRVWAEVTAQKRKILCVTATLEMEGEILATAESKVFLLG